MVTRVKSIYGWNQVCSIYRQKYSVTGIVTTIYNVTINTDLRLKITVNGIQIQEHYQSFSRGVAFLSVTSKVAASASATRIFPYLYRYGRGADPIYRNRLVNMLVNRILKHGKKSTPIQSDKSLIHL